MHEVTVNLPGSVHHRIRADVSPSGAKPQRSGSSPGSAPYSRARVKTSPDRDPGDGRPPAYRDAVRWLESLVRTPPRTRCERERLGLAPIESLLGRIGNPHHGFPAIHVTGSKGKGSTALYTEALLSAAGLRVGTFTSPHLEEWTERIRISGAPIDEAGFVEALERVRPAVTVLHESDTDAAPAFFDALVAAAFSVFADAPVDVAVVEAGIGARLDPTRVCRAVATCVTGVELEHADRLGPAIEDIAREKAAVARPGVPLVIGSMPEAARAVVEREATRAGVPFLRLGREITIRRGAGFRLRDTSRIDSCRGTSSLHGAPGGSEAGSRTSCGDPALTGSFVGADSAEIAVAGRAVPVSLRQPGPHMLENAALALALANEAGALERLDDAAAGAALEAAVLPGRAEVLCEAPLVIADGAHTRASIEALIEVLDTRTTAGTAGLVAVVSVTRGKDAARVLSPLVRRAETVIATTAEPSRSLPSAELASLLEASHPRAAVAGIDLPADAIRAAVRIAGRDGAVCVTGSMYAAGAARRLLRTVRSQVSGFKMPESGDGFPLSRE